MSVWRVYAVLIFSPATVLGAPIPGITDVMVELDVTYRYNPTVTTANTMMTSSLFDLVGGGGDGTEYGVAIVSIYWLSKNC